MCPASHTRIFAFERDCGGERLTCMTIEYVWRGEFVNAEVESVHAAGFERAVIENVDWWTPSTGPTDAGLIRL